MLENLIEVHQGLVVRVPNMYVFSDSNNYILRPAFFQSYNWDARFLDLARHVAGWSKDPKTKVGCVIANGKKNPVMGYNGFPAGVDDIEGRYLDYDLKHKLVLHAEQNAIANANRSLNNNTLYVTYFPCVRCSMQIISTGIKRVVSLKSPKEKMIKHKVDTELSSSVFFEAGIRCDVLEHISNGI